MRPLYHAIDIFSPFAGRLTIQGWVVCQRDARLELRLGTRVWSLNSFGLPSPDVAAVVPGADHVRFMENLEIGDDIAIVHRARLAVIVVGEPDFEITDLGSSLDGLASPRARFQTLMAEHDSGNFLEIGSRARSGNVNRGVVPEGWNYVGLDVLAGENVDVVGDAHELSKMFPQEHFDVVMAISVIEHIMMPWKLALEMNRVMKVGGLGFFSTHQAWPIHDAPWDFWRFSSESWKALFNQSTGFEIVEAAMGEPAFIVAQRCHEATNFGMQPAYLGSIVLVRKIGPTALEWPVSIAAIDDTSYPAGEVPLAS